MNLTVFSDNGTVFTNCECIKSYAFKMVSSRGKSAIFEVINAPITVDFTVLRDNCTHFDRNRNLSLFKYVS